MPLFRFNRKTLDESLKTAIIVTNIDDIIKAALEEFDNIPHTNYGLKVSINYNRLNLIVNGWLNHKVCMNLYMDKIMTPIGFLSESF